VRCQSGRIETMTLRITADDTLAQVYADGVQMKFKPGNWKKVRTVEIPRSTRLIAIKGKDVAKVSLCQ
jgi:hypothetical protein